MKCIKYSLNNNIFCYTCICGSLYPKLYEVYFIENKEKPLSTKTSLITGLPNSRKPAWYPEQTAQQLEYITWEELQRRANEELQRSASEEVLIK